MTFQIKDFASIVAAQINHSRSVTKEITDFQPGSVFRTLMEAPAVEMEELYLQIFLGLRDAIPIATFSSFGFGLLPAARAQGFVSISTSTPPTAAFLIPAGTAFTTVDGRVYTSNADVTWPALASIVRVQVAAAVVGLDGNAAAGVIIASPSFGSGYTISNPAIGTGRDVETEPEREARFAEFVGALSRGTIAACLYVAKLAQVLDVDGNIEEYVTRIGYQEVAGRVSIYVYTSIGVASAELLADGQMHIDGWRDEVTGIATPGYRAGGIDVPLLAMSERAVPMTIAVTMFSGYTLTADVIQQLGDIYSTAITSVQPGATLQLGTLVELLLSVTGVHEIVPATNSNIICDVFEALLPGTFTVNPL